MIRTSPAEALRRQRKPVDASTMSDVAAIVEDVRSNGLDAIERYSAKFDGGRPDDPLVVAPNDMESAFEELPEDQKQLLEDSAKRIADFARAQLGTLQNLSTSVPGGRAGHLLRPVSTVGAYAPGGRYPLPSTVLMTVLPARIAGVSEIWVASPRPTAVTLAAANIAGAGGVLSLGGAHAVASLAFGIVSPQCDLIVGPGSRWVTAAKKYLFGEVGIDGLAGPSEILVVAGEESDPSLVARDLIAQAEHDLDAFPVLVAFTSDFVDAVEAELARQLERLTTAPTARASLDAGWAVVVDDLEAAADVSNSLAPEHLSIHIEEVDDWDSLFTSYGSIFLGAQTGETHADYGIGPNHVLPTGGTARFASGLSVATFLRAQTWLQLSDSAAVGRHTAAFARLEGLEGHARAAMARLSPIDG